MLVDIQKDFLHNSFSPEKHNSMMARIENHIGIEVPWKTFEMPLFLSADFKHKLHEAVVALLKQSISEPYYSISHQSLTDEVTVPREVAPPLFAVVDFALTGSEETGFVPKLVELQGFPSIYGYQYFFSNCIRQTYSIDDNLHAFPSDITDKEYERLLRNAIVGNHDPENVVLLEYKPLEQKTRPDFIVTENIFGVAETDICNIRKEGRTLLYNRNGTWVPIKRAYNRAIVDELQENNAELPFSWTDDLDIEWAGHPNWYFRISKFALPYLEHPSVPTTTFLSELNTIPDNLEDYVLKPLYSFAGKGVNVNPTQADIESVPESEKDVHVLQEKIHYASVVPTPEGKNKAEIRIMALWLPEWDEPKPMISLVRTGRGPMMGVRYNSIPWTGSGACFFEK